MKSRKKGFTLIELLAVIVILAVIILIAVPAVNNIIKGTKKTTFLRSVEGMTEAVNLFVYDKYDGTVLEMQSYEIGSGNIISNGGEGSAIKYDGKINGSGEILVNEKKEYSVYYTDGEFCATKDFTDKEYSIVEGDCTTIDVGGPIISINTDAENILIHKGNYGKEYIIPSASAVAMTGEVVDVITRIDKINLDGSVAENIPQINTKEAIGTKYRVTYSATFENRISNKEIMVTIADLTEAVVSDGYLTRTSSSIKALVNVNDPESGIKDAEFVLYNGDKIVDTKKINLNLSASNDSNGVEHTFTNLEANTKYKVVVKVINNVDLTATKSKEINTSYISKPIIVVEPAAYSQKKKVTITYPDKKDNLVYSYSVGTADSQEIVVSENTVEFDISENNIIIAKIKDGTNVVEGVTYTIDKIDLTSPNYAVLTKVYSNSSGTSLKVVSEDSESGIYGYQFSSDGGITWYPNEPQSSNSYTFVDQNSQDNVFVAKVYNKTYGQYGYEDINGSVLSNEVNSDYSVCPTPTYSIDSTDWTQQKTLTINYGSTTGCTGSYSIDGGINWLSGNKVVVTENDTTVIAKNTDGTNTVTSAGYTVTKIDRTVPESVTHTTNKTSKSITVTATASDTQSGIKMYAFTKDEGTTWTAWQTSNEYTFDGLEAGSYSIKVKAYNGTYGTTSATEEYGAKESTATLVTIVTCPKPEYSIDNVDWAQAKTVTINYGSTTGCTGSYSLDGGSTWTSGTSVTIKTNNAQVVAKNTDGTNTVTAAAYTVTKIDRTEPDSVTFTTSKTTKSITVTASAEDKQSGIEQYAFSKDGGTTWEGWQTSNKYTFNSLTSGIYSIKVKAYNGTYGTTGATESLGVKESTATSVTLTACPTPTYSIDNADWAQAKTVTIDYGSTTGCTGSYSLDNGTTWKTGTSVTITTNNAQVVAKNTDGTNTVTAAAYTVTKIDRTEPDSVTHITSKTTKSITVTASAEDKQSGIEQYAFSKDGGTTWTSWQTNNAYTFNNLTTGTYSIKVKAYNGTYGTTGATESLGAKESTATSVTLTACETPRYSIDNTDWAQQKTVTIDYGSTTGCTGSYSLDNGTTWTTGKSVTIKTNNQNIIAKNTDGTNTVTASTTKITGIDRTPPDPVTHTTIKTTKSITVTAIASDAQSSIERYNFSKDGGTTWTGWQTSDVYTFSDLTTGTYNIAVKAYNGTYGTEKASESLGAKASAATSVTLSACLTPIVGPVVPSGWAQQKTVTIDYGSTTGCTGSYSLDGGSTWKSGTSVTITTNNAQVVAKNTDGTNTVTASTTKITGIDRTVPDSVTFTTSKTVKTIKVTATASDSQSGIKRYAFSIDGGKNYTDWQTSNVYTFSGLNAKTAYSIKVKAYNGTYGTDAASETLGAKESSATSVTTNACPTPEFSVSPRGDVWAKEKTVTITYPASTNNECTVKKYSYKAQEEWNTITTSSTSIKFVANTNNLKAFYGTSTTDGVTATYAVTKVDPKTPISGLSIIYNGSTIANNGTIKGLSTIRTTCSVGGSGVKNYTITIKDGVYAKTIRTETIATTTTSYDYSFEPAYYSQSKYQIVVSCTNGAGETSATKSQYVYYSKPSTALNCEIVSSGNGNCGECPDGIARVIICRKPNAPSNSQPEVSEPFLDCSPCGRY